MPFQKILIAVDSDPVAMRAAEVGVELARAVNGQMALVSVIDRSTADAAAPETPRDELLAEAREHAAAAIQDAKLSGNEFHDPPPWWYPERRSVAAALLARGQATAAETEARAALRAWPRDPLTLQVLGDAEKGAGDLAGSKRDLAEAKRTWRGGEVSLARL